MNILKKLLLPLMISICCFTVIFSACTEDPYKDYVSSGLEPKTKIDNSEEPDLDKWFSDMELHLFTAYSEYYSFDIDLGYTEGYFEHNSLLIFLREDNSSDNVKFVDILERDGKLYPVLERNYIGPDEPVTEDIILYVFYVEILDSGNYTIGEVINKTRTENITMTS